VLWCCGGAECWAAVRAVLSVVSCFALLTTESLGKIPSEKKLFWVLPVIVVVLFVSSVSIQSVSCFAVVSICRADSASAAGEK